jgi:hypothetical protein
MDPHTDYFTAYTDLKKRYVALCARLQIFECNRCHAEFPIKQMRDCSCKRKYCIHCDPISHQRDSDLKLQAQLIRESNRQFPMMFDVPQTQCDGCNETICLICNGDKCAICMRTLCLSDTDSCRAFECANGCGAVICCWMDPKNTCRGCNKVYCTACISTHNPMLACAPLRANCRHDIYGSAPNHYIAHTCRTCANRGKQWLACAHCADKASHHAIMHTACAMLDLRDQLPMEIILLIATMACADPPQEIIDAMALKR